MFQVFKQKSAEELTEKHFTAGAVKRFSATSDCIAEGNLCGSVTQVTKYCVLNISSLTTS